VVRERIPRPSLSSDGVRLPVSRIIRPTGSSPHFPRNIKAYWHGWIDLKASGSIVWVPRRIFNVSSGRRSTRPRKKSISASRQSNPPRSILGAAPLPQRCLRASSGSRPPIIAFGNDAARHSPALRLDHRLSRRAVLLQTRSNWERQASWPSSARRAPSRLLSPTSRLDERPLVLNLSELSRTNQRKNFRGCAVVRREDRRSGLSTNIPLDRAYLRAFRGSPSVELQPSLSGRGLAGLLRFGNAGTHSHPTAR